MFKTNTTSSKTTAKKITCQHIVILGAGYCGLQVALKLAKQVKNNQLKITLIDRNNYHVYFSELYEIASAFPLNNNANFPEQLKSTLSFDLKTVFKDKPVNLIVQEIINLDPTQKTIKLADQTEINYDYLVVTLGSENNFYGNLELQKNAYTLKTLSDSLRLNSNLLAFFAKHHAQIGKTLKPRLAIVGGGFTGIELIAEIACLIKKLAIQYSFPVEAVDLMVIEPKDQLVGLGQAVSSLTVQRLTRLGIKINFNSSVESFDGKQMLLKHTPLAPNNLVSSQTLPVDFLVWTAGIQAPSLLKSSFPKLSAKFELEARPTLEAIHYKNIFVGGDNSFFIDPKTQKPLPKLGQLAVQQAPLIADNIIASINGRPLKIFQPFFKGFLVSIGGKYGVYCKGKLVFGGFLPWALKMFVDLTYYLSILPVSLAWQKWYNKEKIFTKND